MSIKMILSSIISLIVIITQAHQVLANTEVFRETFEDDVVGESPLGWTVKRNMQWNYRGRPCKNGASDAKWIVSKDSTGNQRAEITLNGEACVFELKKDNFLIPDTSSYQLDIDMTFGANTYVHRNIAYRYEDDMRWYDIKFFHNNGVEFQKANPGADRNPGAIYLSNQFQPNKTYHMTITTINDLVTFYMDGTKLFQYLDYWPILNYGGIALQASSAPDETYLVNTTQFDNIVVTDLREHLEVAHLSQIDEKWAGEIYDHAPIWANPGSDKIKNWGCALTSAAMVLKYYGHQTDPKVLNQYLIDHGGYNNWGGVIWSYFTQFANVNKQNPQNTHLPDLEFTYPEYSAAQLQTDLASRQPDIIRLVHKAPENGMHFVVATGPLANLSNLLIQDPAKPNPGTAILSQAYPDSQLSRLGRFTPSYTDLSYLWAFGSDNLVEFQLTPPPTSNLVPQIFTDGGIKDDLSNQTSETYRTILLPKPISGRYLLNVTAKEIGYQPVEIAAFDRSAADFHTTFHLFTGPDLPRQIIINFDATNSQNTRFNISTSIPLITQIVNYGYSKDLVDQPAYRHLLHMLAQIDKHLQKPTGNSAAALIGALISQIRDYSTQNLIDSELGQTIITELEQLPVIH